MRGIVCDRRQPAERFGKNKRTLDLSEAPQAYKNIEDVNRRRTVQVRLTPLAVIKG